MSEQTQDERAQDAPTEATALVGPAAPRTKRSRARRLLRANNWLGIIIPALIVLLAIKGYKLVVFQTSAYIAHVLHRPVLAKAYAIQFNVFLWPILGCWLAVWIISARSVPPNEIPQEVLDRTMVFECDKEGKPLVCWQDGCAGRWRPMRSRHCRDCGTCRTGFDHHCAFMSACVTSSNLPFFLLFLVLTLPLIGIAIIPLIPLQFAAVKEVIDATWSSDWLREVWWSRWYAWAGGPIWRYAFALGLGFWHWPRLDPPRAPLFEAPIDCARLARPNLGGLLTCVAGFFVFWIAVAMIVTILRNAAEGLTSVQVTRHRAWLALGSAPPAEGSQGWDPRLRLWVPAPVPEEGEERREGGMLLVDPGMRLYDFGSRGENLWRALGWAGAGEHLPERVVRELQGMIKSGENLGAVQ